MCTGPVFLEQGQAATVADGASRAFSFPLHHVACWRAERGGLQATFAWPQ